MKDFLWVIYYVEISLIKKVARILHIKLWCRREEKIKKKIILKN